MTDICDVWYLNFSDKPLYELWEEAEDQVKNYLAQGDGDAF